MKLLFLGKRKNGCRTCSKQVGFETRIKYSLYSPYGIKEFSRSRVYEFTNSNEYTYWRSLKYKAGKRSYHYFREII